MLYCGAFGERGEIVFHSVERILREVSSEVQY